MTAVAGLGLTFDTAPLPVLKRKLPRVSETLEMLPCLLVCPSTRPERYQPAAEGLVFLDYAVDVSMAAPGNRDWATNLDQYLQWRQQIRGLFQGPLLAGVSAVYDTDITPGTPIDRTLVNSNYDYSTLGLLFSAIERR